MIKQIQIVRSFSNAARLGRADRGLYAGKGISFGNTVSDFGNTNRRSWKPNVQRVSLFSETLGERIRLRVTTEALRRIDHDGGLDNYILNQKTPESECAKKLQDRLFQKKLEASKTRNELWN